MLSSLLLQKRIFLETFHVSSNIKGREIFITCHAQKNVHYAHFSVQFFTQEAVYNFYHLKDNLS
jgi:hypothetical protein